MRRSSVFGGRYRSKTSTKRNTRAERHPVSTQNLTDASFAQEPGRHADDEHHDDHWTVIQVPKDLHFAAGVHAPSVASSSVVRDILVVVTSTWLGAVGIVGGQRIHVDGMVGMIEAAERKDRRKEQDMRYDGSNSNFWNVTARWNFFRMKVGSFSCFQAQQRQDPRCHDWIPPAPDQFLMMILSGQSNTRRRRSVARSNYYQHNAACVDAPVRKLGLSKIIVGPNNTLVNPPTQ